MPITEEVQVQTDPPAWPYESAFPRCPTHGRSYTVEITASDHVQRCIEDSCKWQTPVITAFWWPDGATSYFIRKEDL